MVILVFPLGTGIPGVYDYAPGIAMSGYAARKSATQVCVRHNKASCLKSFATPFGKYRKARFLLTATSRGRRVFQAVLVK